MHGDLKRDYDCVEHLINICVRIKCMTRYFNSMGQLKLSTAMVMFNMYICTVLGLSPVKVQHLSQTFRSGAPLVWQNNSIFDQYNVMLQQLYGSRD